jgi:hypothetical protein
VRPQLGRSGQLYGLLFTFVVLFALQGGNITSRPLDVARIALPLLADFAAMWGGGYLLGEVSGLSYAHYDAGFHRWGQQLRARVSSDRQASARTPILWGRSKLRPGKRVR